jgi:nicotinamide-nucleotide amidase
LGGLPEARVVIATAESCTGGGVPTAITRISGSAEVVRPRLRHVLQRAKREMLGVSRSARSSAFGAVSEEAAREMARGALRRSPADVSVAITGIAGPTGARGEARGPVWFAWAARGHWSRPAHFRFAGDRVAVRAQSVSPLQFKGLEDLLR